MMNLFDLTWVLSAYLIGSIPFGILLAKLRGVDLRAVGSGNIGATNAMRALGKPLGFVAFALDFGKGFLVPWCLLHAEIPGGSDWDLNHKLMVASAAGVGAAAGHVWPLWIRFRGGKAVATALGALCAIDPLVALWGGPVWLLAVFFSSHVSVGSLAMSASFPITAWIRRDQLEGSGALVAAAALLCLLIWVRHRPNIERLLQGTEARTRLGLRGAKSDRDIGGTA
jgi:glycerol-3-phosphate acyltransferase PlsY